MIYISHRGNFNGVCPERENSPEYIQEAIDRGFHVEIDLRIKNNLPHLGHDQADYEVNEYWLHKNRNSLWIHIKEYAALQWILERTGFVYFCHQSDAYTLVSNGKVWCHDWNNELNEHCIVPLISKEQLESYDKNSEKIYAVCSDYILDCIRKFEN
jgi:hypothetical protein